ncbi:MAG: 30S ribosomal protein S5, partial [Rhodoluna sp.]
KLEEPASVAARRGLTLEEVAPKVILKAQADAKAGA